MSIELILGYPVFWGKYPECLKELTSSIEMSTRPLNLACLNPHSFEVACKDSLFQTALKQADFLIPDGVGIVIASKILGGNISERITGSDIFSGLSNSLNEIGSYRYFFLGSTEEILAKIKIRLAQDFPDIVFAGAYSPPYKAEFSKEDSRKMIEAVNAAKPDVLWVGMTAPKQEKWIYQHKDKLDVKFIGAVGAVFDFYVGNVKRSHPVFQKMGLEWMPRLLQEPKRLWRRNFVSNPLFLLRVLQQRFMGKS